MASKKNDGMPKPGERWHLVFSVYPDLTKEMADEAERVYRLGMSGVATINEFDAYSNPNTIDVDLTYIKQPQANFAEGTTANFGPYTLTLAHKDRIS